MATFTLTNRKSGATATVEIPDSHLSSASTAADYLVSVGRITGKIRTVASVKGDTWITAIHERMPITWELTRVAPIAAAAVARRISTVQRPYLLTFHATGTTYPLTSDDAQRLLDEYPAVSATKYRVVLQGHNSGRASDRTSIRPATIGGGPAFVIERTK